MLEVVFSDSAKGSMRMAKSYDAEQMKAGPTAYFGKKPSAEKLEKMFAGKAVGGRSDEVVAIGFNLDVGDIAGAVDGEGRKAEFVRMFASVEFEVDEVNSFFEMQGEDVRRMVESAKQGEGIRIWRSKTAFAACGFAFVCDVLREVACDLWVVDLPAVWENDEGEIERASGWGEMRPGQFYRFLPLMQKVSRAEKIAESDLWKKLQAENAALRAVVNGRLVSVETDFYDQFIKREIPEGEFLMGRLIGNVLGKYGLGISDGWIALRLKQMIEEGQLRVVAVRDEHHPYGKMLAKVN
jgi:hypothetical protein